MTPDGDGHDRRPDRNLSLLPYPSWLSGLANFFYYKKQISNPLNHFEVDHIKTKKAEHSFRKDCGAYKPNHPLERPIRSENDFSFEVQKFNSGQHQFGEICTKCHCCSKNEMTAGPWAQDCFGAECGAEGEGNSAGGGESEHDGPQVLMLFFFISLLIGCFCRFFLAVWTQII